MKTYYKEFIAALFYGAVSILCYKIYSISTDHITECIAGALSLLFFAGSFIENMLFWSDYLKEENK